MPWTTPSARAIAEAEAAEMAGEVSADEDSAAYERCLTRQSISAPLA